MEKKTQNTLLKNKLQSLKNTVNTIEDIFRSVNVSVGNPESGYRKSAMWQPVYVKNDLPPGR